MTIQELESRKQELEQTLEDVKQALKNAYHQKTQGEIIAFGQRHGLDLHYGMMITSTQAIADFIVKDAPQWVNPPARKGAQLELVGVSGDYVRCVDRWILAIPVHLVKEALESEAK